MSGILKTEKKIEILVTNNKHRISEELTALLRKFMEMLQIK
jgi:hypothetical protein